MKLILPALCLPRVVSCSSAQSLQEPDGSLLNPAVIHVLDETGAARACSDIIERYNAFSLVSDADLDIAA